MRGGSYARSYAPWLLVLSLVGCTKLENTLTGSESQVYNLSFDKVVIELQGTYVSIKYIASTGEPAILVVDTANITDVAGTSIDLTQLVSGQPRGVLQNVNGGGDGVTNQLIITRGFVSFDQVPKLPVCNKKTKKCTDSTLSGQFNTTLSDGFILDGTFSAGVNPPA